MKICSVFDEKAGAYTLPFIAETTATAIRTFGKAVNEEGSVWGQTPGDYTLFELGEWDAHDAQITQHEAKKNLGCAIEFMETTPTGVIESHEMWERIYECEKAIQAAVGMNWKSPSPEDDLGDSAKREIAAIRGIRGGE